jgi:hypothetical protein
VTAPKLPVETPPLLLKATVSPPEVKLLAAASLVLRVTVMAEPELTVPLETLTNDWANEKVPGDTVTVGNTDVIADPPTVEVIVVAVPAVVAVKMAE